MRELLLALGCAASLGVASSAQAAFLVEIDTDGADDGVLTYHPNFSFGGDTTTASQSSPSSAVGLNGADSIFGGNGTNFPDTYQAKYTPAIDGDSIDLSGQALNVWGDVGSSIVAGGSGDYAIYATWPHTNNVSGNPITFTLGEAAGDLATVSLNQNSAVPQRDVTGDGIPDPGSGGEWIYLFTVTLDANTEYTLRQEAGTNSFVSMRASGYLFDAVPEPASLGLMGMGGLVLLSRKRA